MSSFKDYLHMQRNQAELMAEQGELKPIYQQMVDAANKRIRRLEESGVYSPALENLKDRMGANPRFSGKGVKYGKLTSEQAEKLAEDYLKVSNFLNDKTSTTRGASKMENQFFKLINADQSERGIDKGKFWDVVNKLKIKDPYFVMVKYKHILQTVKQEVLQSDETRPVDDIVADMEKKMQEMYEADEAMDTSSFSFLHKKKKRRYHSQKREDKINQMRESALNKLYDMYKDKDK